METDTNLKGKGSNLNVWGWVDAMGWLRDENARKGHFRSFLDEVVFGCQKKQNEILAEMAQI